MNPPGHDFYATTAQVIPLLLVTAALEAEKLIGGDGEQPLTLGILFFAVLGETSAVAGLTGGGGRTTAALVIAGMALLAVAIVAPLTLQALPTKDTSWWRRYPQLALGFSTAFLPLLAGVLYVVHLYA